MDSTTLVAESKEDAEQSVKGMQSLYEVCQEVADGRCARGKRYELAGVLVVLVLAKLAGMQSLSGASDWVRDQEALLREGLRLTWKRMPCANTSSYALARLDSQKVNTALAAWYVRKEAASRCAGEPSRLAAQASEPMEERSHRSRCCMCMRYERALCCSSVLLEAEHNEVSTLKPLLTEVLCKGRILTSDAAQSYHDFGRLVKRAGGEVIVFVKDNAPATRADLELFFEDPDADRRTWQSYEHTHKGHGRLERRQITTRPDLNDYRRLDWGEVGQVFRVERERQSKQKSSVEVVYGRTTLSP